MASNVKSLYPGGFGERVMRFLVESGGMDAGQLAIRNADATTAGEVEDPTNTGAADLMGVCLDTVAYSTSQATYSGLAYPGDSREETASVAMIPDPFGVIALPVSGGAAGGTALAADINIITVSTANTAGTTITTAASTIDMDGGLVCGYTGNNAGVVRRMTVHTDNVSDTVLVPFPRTIAAGDKFIRVPFSRSALAVQLCDTAGAGQFGECNGIIAYGTGAPFRVTDVIFDILNAQAMIHCLAGDHFYQASA